MAPVPKRLMLMTLSSTRTGDESAQGLGVCHTRAGVELAVEGDEDPGEPGQDEGHADHIQQKRTFHVQYSTARAPICSDDWQIFSGAQSISR
ncbi:hypothetical protein PLUA15_250009 [Pseudomonas lundensis]|uniref:Uncharacterized protein n=1 Tax=Pseudomonas lundensis TaxID=86185 RepID=A0AAX2H7W1_9PSED|nr:hypothetical protein PLUA15_250009 [Pseudomonas lundensis]